MGSFTIPQYPYGHPKNEDYAYDVARQRKVDMEQDQRDGAGNPQPPMSDLGKHLFEQMALINDGQRIAAKLGRQQMARDVVGWIHANAHLLGGAPIESLLALCNKELK